MCGPLPQFQIPDLFRCFQIQQHLTLQEKKLSVTHILFLLLSFTNYMKSDFFCFVLQSDLGQFHMYVSFRCYATSVWTVVTHLIQIFHHHCLSGRMLTDVVTVMNGPSTTGSDFASIVGQKIQSSAKNSKQRMKTCGLNVTPCWLWVHSGHKHIFLSLCAHRRYNNCC